MRKAIMSCVFGLALLSLATSVPVANADIEGGLVGHWTFDEGSGTTANDSVGDNDGTLNGGPQWVEGQILGALDFDGLDDYVGIQRIVQDDFTLAAWIKTDTPGISAGDQAYQGSGLIWSDVAGVANDFILAVLGTKLSFFCGNPDLSLNSDRDVVTGDWVHVVATRSAQQQTMTIYIDGQQEGTADHANSGPLDAQPLIAIGGNTLDSRYYTGIIDEVRLYDRALSAEDVEELYNWRGGAYAGKDQAVYGGDTVTLTGSGPSDATSFTWQQIAGEPQVTFIPDPPNQAVVEFDAPQLDIGTILTFKLTVDAPSTGITTDEVDVTVRAVNVPKVAPSNLRVLPMDFGPSGLGFRLVWDPLVDAERYMLAMKLGDQYFWMYNTTETQYDFMGMFEGQEQIVAVRGENKYSDPNPASDPSLHGLQSQDVRYIAMPNVASAGGTTPPSQRLASGTPVPPGMNDGVTDDHNDSTFGVDINGGGPGQGKMWDWWGFQWDTPLFFDHMVYYTGEFSGNGGWFVDLKVQVTDDGTTWRDLPGVTVTPPYDFSDARSGRENFTRYDIFMPTARGLGIRIYGTPGGRHQYTSVAELQVFGNQVVSGAPFGQGVDAQFPEGSRAILDGTPFFSFTGEIVSYEWQQVSGTTVGIENPTAAIAYFDAPIVDADTELVFSLTVSDGTDSATDDDVRITVKNVATTAEAGPDQRVVEGDSVTLDGSASLTTTGTISYLWTQTAGTLVGVTGNTDETVTFTAPVLWGFMEELTFELQVNDGAITDTDEVTVLVYNFVGTILPLGSGYFKDLLHMGEDTTDRITSPTGINSEILEKWGGEANINPRPGEEYDFSDTTVEVTTNPMIWTPEHVDNGWFADSGRPEHVLDSFQQIYHLYIISPEDRDVLWYFRHDNELRVHNNGVPAVSRDAWDNAEMMRAGPLATNRGLTQGVNSLAIKFAEGDGGNYMAVRLTDLEGNEFTDLEYSLGPPFWLADAYAARILPLSYEAGGSLNVELSVRVNPDNVPTVCVNIMENVPVDIPDGFIFAPGATVSGGKIIWSLCGDQVETGTLSYSIKVPAEMTQGMNFSGTVSFGTTTGDIFGHDVVYAVPSAPGYVEAEMLVAAHLSWSAPPEEGVASYRIFRSDDGGAYQEIATVAGTSYVDMSVVSGVNYSYQVSAINVRGVEGSASVPTVQATVADMTLVEAEDFNYGGGLYPGPGPTDVPAVEAPGAGDYDLAYDYFFQSTTYPSPNGYRPKDDVDCRESTPGQWIMGYTSVGDWWRYTVNVPTAGWVKVVLKLASPGGGSLSAFWDEQPVGNVSFVTGSWGTYIWFPVEESFQSDAGVHTLRVEKTGGEMDFDTIAFGWDWTPPRRKVIWEDNFEAYASTQEVIDNGGWEIINGSTDPDTGEPAPTADGAWQRWDVDTMISGESGDIAGMDGNYMVSNSDASGSGFLLNEELISPEIDCAGWTKLRLNFSRNYRIYDDPDHLQNADVDIRVFDSVTGWSDWVTLVHLDTSSVPAGLDPPILSAPEQIDISVYDGKTIQLRWHFYDAEFDYWFAVDDVRVSGIEPEGPPPSITGWTYDGTNVSITWEAFGDGTYYVEYTTDLTSGLWQGVAGPLTETTWSTEMPGDVVGFARVRSAAP